MISREEAIDIVVRYVGAQYLRHLQARGTHSFVTAGWPCKDRPFLRDDEDECPWVAVIPFDQPGIGAARCVALSRITGKIIADINLGE